MRRWRTWAASVAFASTSLVACSVILGIDEKPLRNESDADVAIDAHDDADSDNDGAPDAEPDVRCRLLESQGCGSCAHDFCDDFDVDGQAPAAHWKAPTGFKNPIAQGDAGLNVSAPALSLPAALVATASSSGTRAFAMLVEQLSFAEHHAGHTFDGVRIAVDVRLDALRFTGTDAGRATVLGLLRTDKTPPSGVAILLSGTAVQLVVSEDVLGGTGDAITAPVNDSLNVPSLLNNWVRLEVFVGDRDRALREGYACQSVGRGLVAAASLGSGLVGHTCVQLPPSFASTPWTSSPALLVGALLLSPGRASVRSDNVVADFFER
jgi:hypothetical protein